MGQSTHGPEAHATINSFRMQRLAAREGSARAQEDKDLQMASNELYVVPSQVSMAIYNSNLETLAKKEVSNSIASGTKLTPAVQSNQVSHAVLGGRSVPTVTRGELPSTSSKNHAIVFSQHQGRNSLGKFR